MMYHNFRANEAETTEEIIFCADSAEKCDHYGNIHRTFSPESARLDDGTALKMAADFYGNVNDLNDCVYPAHIVETAGAWDDVEFINYLYDNNYFNNFDAIITPDGAVVFDYTLMVRV